MEARRVVVYLKSGRGAIPMRTIYLTEDEYDRLRKDYTEYQKAGRPSSGTYIEAISTTKEQHEVCLEFGSIEYIKATRNKIN
jgi:hypothetical protein